MRHPMIHISYGLLGILIAALCCRLLQGVEHPTVVRFYEQVGWKLIPPEVRELRTKRKALIAELPAMGPTAELFSSFIVNYVSNIRTISAVDRLQTNYTCLILNSISDWVTRHNAMLVDDECNTNVAIVVAEYADDTDPSKPYTEFLRFGDFEAAITENLLSWLPTDTNSDDDARYRLTSSVAKNLMEPILQALLADGTAKQKLIRKVDKRATERAFVSEDGMAVEALPLDSSCTIPKLLPTITNGRRPVEELLINATSTEFYETYLKAKTVEEKKTIYEQLLKLGDASGFMLLLRKNSPINESMWEDAERFNVHATLLSALTSEIASISELQSKTLLRSLYEQHDDGIFWLDVYRGFLRNSNIKMVDHFLTEAIKVIPMKVINLLLTVKPCASSNCNWPSTLLDGIGTLEGALEMLENHCDRCKLVDKVERLINERGGWLSRKYLELETLSLEQLNELGSTSLTRPIQCYVTYRAINLGITSFNSATCDVDIATKLRDQIKSKIVFHVLAELPEIDDLTLLDSAFGIAKDKGYKGQALIHSDVMSIFKLAFSKAIRQADTLAHTRELINASLEKHFRNRSDIETIPSEYTEYSQIYDYMFQKMPPLSTAQGIMSIWPHFVAPFNPQSPEWNKQKELLSTLSNRDKKLLFVFMKTMPDLYNSLVRSGDLKAGVFEWALREAEDRPAEAAWIEAFEDVLLDGLNEWFNEIRIKNDSLATFMFWNLESKDTPMDELLLPIRNYLNTKGVTDSDSFDFDLDARGHVRLEQLAAEALALGKPLYDAIKEKLEDPSERSSDYLLFLQAASAQSIPVIPELLPETANEIINIGKNILQTVRADENAKVKVQEHLCTEIHWALFRGWPSDIAECNKTEIAFEAGTTTIGTYVSSLRDVQSELALLRTESRLSEHLPKWFVEWPVFKKELELGDKYVTEQGIRALSLKGNFIPSYILNVIKNVEMEFFDSCNHLEVSLGLAAAPQPLQSVMTALAAMPSCPGLLSGILKASKSLDATVANEEVLKEMLVSKLLEGVVKSEDVAKFADTVSAQLARIDPLLLGVELKKSDLLEIKDATTAMEKYTELAENERKALLEPTRWVGPDYDATMLVTRLQSLSIEKLKAQYKNQSWYQLWVSQEKIRDKIADPFSQDAALEFKSALLTSGADDDAQTFLVELSPEQFLEDLSKWSESLTDKETDFTLHLNDIAEHAFRSMKATNPETLHGHFERVFAPIHEFKLGDTFEATISAIHNNVKMEVVLSLFDTVTDLREKFILEFLQSHKTKRSVEVAMMEWSLNPPLIPSIADLEVVCEKVLTSMGPLERSEVSAEIDQFLTREMPSTTLISLDYPRKFRTDIREMITEAIEKYEERLSMEETVD